MVLDMAAYYEDGSSKAFRMDKPPGAHPDSPYTGTVALGLAAVPGKVCVRIARCKVTNRGNGDLTPVVHETTVWEGRHVA